MKFYRYFTPTFCSFLRVSKPTFKYSSFHLDITSKTKVFTISNELVSGTHLLVWYHTSDECIYHQRQESLCYSPPNTISHCRQMLLSLAMRQSLLLTSEYDITYTADEMFIASHGCILCWRQTLLALKTNAFHAGDEHIAGDKHAEAHIRTSAIHSHTHTHS